MFKKHLQTIHMIHARELHLKVLLTTPSRPVYTFIAYAIWRNAFSDMNSYELCYRIFLPLVFISF